MQEDDKIEKAKSGDIRAFEQLFSAFSQQLKSYLYRLLANRNDAEDIAHDTFVRAFEKISSFRREAGFKTWVFRIATNLACDELRKRRRWQEDAQDKARTLAGGSEEIKKEFRAVHSSSPYGRYEITEHIDFCFTCIGKTLPIEEQVTLILKDVYDFQLREIQEILELSEGKTKHLLSDARKTMTDIFERRCALVNKTGTCHQCSELNGFFNPRQNLQQKLLSVELVRESGRKNHEELYTLRTKLIRTIDPLRCEGTDLQELIMKCTRKATGE